MLFIYVYLVLAHTNNSLVLINLIHPIPLIPVVYWWCLAARQTLKRSIWSLYCAKKSVNG